MKYGDNDLAIVLMRETHPCSPFYGHYLQCVCDITCTYVVIAEISILTKLLMKLRMDDRKHYLVIERLVLTNSGRGFI